MERKQNKRFICLVRASDDADGTTSTEAQLEWLKAGAEDKGMRYVDAMILDGVTGSLPGRREDLKKLLDRKRQADDFDCIVVQRIDRLTRGGTAHGFWFEHECACLGIELIYMGDDIPDGPYSNLIKVAKFEAAREQAFSISQRSTQGAQLALEQGRNVTSSHTPFGCWRLYSTAEGIPSHIIADLRDGRQQKRDPKTYAVIDVYGQIGGGSKGHFRKQKSDRTMLMPGFAEETAVVREIFDLHFRQGYGGKRIADVLNRRGVRSPQGKQWSQHQVEVIYQQEVYTGRSVGNRTTSAIYHERSPSAPKRVELDAAVRATAKNIPVRQRPQAEWLIQPQPLMEDFLDAELRKMAMAEHEQLWRARGDVDRPKRSKSKHQASDYLLSGLLFAKQDGEPLVGVLCGRVGKKVRYYRHRRGRRGYMKGSPFNRMIAAKPLEDAVVGVVADILNDEQDLRERIIAAAEAKKRNASPGEQLVDLRQRRERLKRRTELIVSTLDDESLADARQELDRLKSERRALDDQIATAKASAAMGAMDASALADAIVAQLQQMLANIAEMPKFAIRQMLATVVEKVVVDMETKEIEIFLAASPSLVSTSPSGDKAMRLVGTSASSTCDETHRRHVVHLAVADCSYVKHANGCRYNCRRRRAA